MAYETRIVGRNQAGGRTGVKVDHGGAIRDISYEHYAIHDDKLVIASDITTEAGSTAPYAYAVTVPAGKVSHSQFQVKGDVPYTFKLYEAETTDVTTGSLITHARFNRSSTIGDTDDAWTLGGVVVADRGTLLYQDYSGGTTAQGNNQPTGAPLKPDEEWNLFPGKTYLIYIEPVQDGGTFSFHNDYYDVDG